MASAEVDTKDAVASVAAESVGSDGGELHRLRAQLRGMELIMQQNAALEKEIDRLCNDLDEATAGVHNKGYLYKYRERIISFASSKWALRFFVLRGNKLSYYTDDLAAKPRRTVDLSKCFIRDEGSRQVGSFFAFSIYFKSGEEEENLLMRLSSDSEACAAHWKDTLSRACSLRSSDPDLAAAYQQLFDTEPAEASADPKSRLEGMGCGVGKKHYGNALAVNGGNNDHDSSSGTIGGQGDRGKPGIKHGFDGASASLLQQDADTERSAILQVDVNHDHDHDDWGHHWGSMDVADLQALEREGSLPAGVLKRVQSSSLALRRSKSRPSVGAFTATGVGTGAGARLAAGGRSPRVGRSWSGEENKAPAAYPAAGGGDSRAASPPRSPYSPYRSPSEHPAVPAPVPAAALAPAVVSVPVPMPLALQPLEKGVHEAASASGLDSTSGSAPASELRRRTKHTNEHESLSHASNVVVADHSNECSRAAVVMRVDSTDKLHANRKKKKKGSSFPGYRPMHVESMTSPLSAQQTHRREQNFRGFFNLGVIILVMSHFDLIISNMKKYGLQMSLPLIRLSQHPEILRSSFLDVLDVTAFSSWYGAEQHLLNSALSLGSWFLSLGAHFLVERLAARRLLPETGVFAVNCLLGVLNLAGPTYWVWVSPSHPIPKMIYLFQSVVLWMKLVSYAHANSDLREAARSAKREDREAGIFVLSRASSIDKLADGRPHRYDENMRILFTEVQNLEPPYLLYPQNLTIVNLAYFAVAPTLCYQLNYPRAPKLRWRYVALTLLRLVVVGIIMVFSIEQYIVPQLEAVIQPMQRKDVLSVGEKLVQLSIPNTYVWLLGFYWFFHLWLNLLAELTRFGDRQFYKSWWNARQISYYWRTWNLPVHNWVIRHMYYPLVRMGLPKPVAPFVIFFFSAAFHELIISVPFKHILFHAFFGMLAQAPLMLISKYIDLYFDNGFVGNALFWCSFCVLGQPMGIILYYYDLYTHAAAAAVASAAASLAVT